MDGRPTWTDFDEAGDYFVPNVLSPRDLVSRPDKIDETDPHKGELHALYQSLTLQILVCYIHVNCMYQCFVPGTDSGSSFSMLVLV